MRGVLSCLSIAFCAFGCGSPQHTTSTTTPTEDMVSTEQAIAEVTELAVQHCEDGIHGSLDHVASEGPLLIVGTAGEIVDGRSSLEEVNASRYGTQQTVVRHDCENVQRFTYASARGDIVWVEEAIRTHVTEPGFSVDFPSQRTLLFERTPEGWRLRYYSLSVRLPDDQLDEAYAQPPETRAEPAPETPEAQPE